MFRRALVLAPSPAQAVALAVPAGATSPGTNGKLLFERPAGNGSDLFSVGANGSGLARLTKRKGAEGDASWSPDGSKIAVTCATNAEEGPYEICRMNADGSGYTKLTRHRKFSLAPAWSPDGTKIVYSSNAGRGDQNGSGS